MRENIINYRKQIMNSRETLILHTLKFKQLHTSGSNFSGDIVDKLLEADSKAADEITKNVCARIPLELANEMEQLGGMIGLNKREIITMAIHDFLEKARGVIDEFDALPEEQ